MSRKFKRFLSIMMVAVMVIAMAAACGKKEEEAAEPEKKEDTKVEAEKEAESDNQQANAGGNGTNEEMSVYGVTERELQDWYDIIESNMITEYIEPNNIKDFQWPTDEVFWSDCATFLAEYAIFLNLQSMDLDNLDVELSNEEVAVYKELQQNEPSVDELYTSEDNKAIIQTIYIATKKWIEKDQIDFNQFKLDQFSCQENFIANTFK